MHVRFAFLCDIACLTNLNNAKTRKKIPTLDGISRKQISHSQNPSEDDETDDEDETCELDLVDRC